MLNTLTTETKKMSKCETCKHLIKHTLTCERHARALGYSLRVPGFCEAGPYPTTPTTPEGAGGDNTERTQEDK